MGVAFFDLDNTLIAGDSDHLWGEFLVEIGAVPAQAYRRENDRFMLEYERGTLDVEEFLTFALRPLALHPPETLHGWRDQFVKTRIAPLVLPNARALLEHHRERGRPVVIITSTNHFITEPIATLLGADALLATRPIFERGRYTGSYVGTPCAGVGKVTHARDWLARRTVPLSACWFYTDSSTDLPLMEAVGNPVAVDPDPRLHAVAQSRHWPVISLR